MSPHLMSMNHLSSSHYSLLPDRQAPLPTGNQLFQILQRELQTMDNLHRLPSRQDYPLEKRAEPLQAEAEAVAAAVAQAPAEGPVGRVPVVKWEYRWWNELDSCSQAAAPSP